MFCLISLGFCSAQELSSSATTSTSSVVSEDFYAPFFTTWFCSMGTILFLPIYLIGLLLSGAKSSKIRANLKESIQSFRSKGFTLGKLSIKWSITVVEHQRKSLTQLCEQCWMRLFLWFANTVKVLPFWKTLCNILSPLWVLVWNHWKKADFRYLERSVLCR